MDRIPEPELMDDEAQAKAYADADFAAPHERFVDLLQDSVGAQGLQGHVVDLGCGPADVTIRTARRFPDTEIDGIDGSEAMLKLGRDRVARVGLSSRVRLFRCRLPQEPLPHSAYDAVISNSLLHHLRDPIDLWATIAQYAALTAPVFIMDLRRPDHIAEVDRLVETYAVNEPAILRRDFRASLCAAFTVEEVQAQLRASGLSLHVWAVSDRHLVACGRR
jgi:trans-aconitate methyltransferase